MEGNAQAQTSRLNQSILKEISPEYSLEELADVRRQTPP